MSEIDHEFEHHSQNMASKLASKSCECKDYDGKDDDSNKDKFIAIGTTTTTNTIIKTHQQWKDSIKELMAARAEFRRQKDWSAADAIKKRLLQSPYCVEIIDYAGEKPSVWVAMKKKPLEPSKSIVWSALSATSITKCFRVNDHEHKSAGIGDANIGIGFNNRETGIVIDNESNSNVVREDDENNSYHQHAQNSGCVGLVICTVDSPSYHFRLSDTLAHLKERLSDCSCSLRRQHRGRNVENPEPVCLLDLKAHPSLSIKNVVLEGWRTVLLPHLLSSTNFQQRDGYSASRESNGDDEAGDNGCYSISSSSSFVLIAEDDIRFPITICQNLIVQTCCDVFDAHPTLDILSLGHAWKGLSNTESKNQRSLDLPNKNDYDSQCRQQPQSSLLLDHLACGGGVHGSTLLAVRFPDGLQRLQVVLDGLDRRKKTHFDQFLFHSTHHNLSIALSDPPLVGWAEVSETLTTSGSGHRRLGGGRRPFLPPLFTTRSSTEVVQWVARNLVLGK